MRFISLEIAVTDDFALECALNSRCMRILSEAPGQRAQSAQRFISFTPVTAISKEMKRTVGALRQQALTLGISLGPRR